jgi:hypothetical protein
MVKDLKVIFGKGPGGQSILKDPVIGHAAMWKKKSIFWELPYWENLEVRSSIDVMHVTKNLCMNLLGFLGVYGKTKDTPEAREDQQRIKNPYNKHTDKGHQYLSSYALTKAENEIFFECLSSIKVPARFSSNIKRIINMAEKKFHNLKSHDCHVIMTQLLLVPLRGLLPENVRVLTWVCPSGTHGLVYRVRPIKEVDRNKDSKINLETKKEGSNTYSTRTLVNLSPVAYIKSGRGVPRGTSYNIIDTQYKRDKID